MGSNVRMARNDPRRFPIVPSPRARFHGSAPVSFFTPTTPRDNQALVVAEVRRGQNPTPTHAHTLRRLSLVPSAAPRRALLLLSPRGRECSTRISSSRGRSRSARYGASAPFIAPPIPLVAALIALVSLPDPRNAFGSIPSSDKSRSVFFCWSRTHACADSAATNCVRLFVLWLQDGGDAPLEDQPQAARQARHHQNLVRKLARAIRVPPCREGIFLCFFVFADFCLCVSRLVRRF